MEQENVDDFSAIEDQVILEQKQGKTVSYIAIDKKTVGYITIKDAIKESSFDAIQELKRQSRCCRIKFNRL